MSTVWIINQYLTTPTDGMGARHHNFALKLAERGHKVHLIGASWHHYINEGVDPLPIQEERPHYTVTRLPVRTYPSPHHPGRIANWLLFGWRLRRLPKLIKDVPDTIYYTSPSLFGLPTARRLARRFGARFVVEIRDIWPLTLVELGGKSPSHPLLRWMQRIEDTAYREADAVISNLSNAVEHMTSRGMDPGKFTWIPNGFVKEIFENPEPLSDDFTLPEGKVIFGYAGSMGTANNMEIVLDVAERLRDRDDIAFVLVGRGQSKEALIADARARGLANIHFRDPIKKQQVSSLLARFDVCLICSHATPLYRFGMSFNKLFEYLIAGKPIIYGVDSGGYRPVSTAQAGLTVPPDNVEQFADAVVALAEMSPEQRKEMGRNGHRHALDHYEFTTLTDRLEAVLFPWQGQKEMRS